MQEMIQYRASRVEVRKMAGGAMILAQKDGGQVVIYITDPQLQTLVRQTKLLQSDATDPPVLLSDKPQE